MNYTPEYNFFNILIISASIYGILFSLAVLLSKKRRQPSNRYLGLGVLFISLNNLYFWIIDTNLYLVYGWENFDLYAIPWDLLMLPMFYYFVAYYLNRKDLMSSYYTYPFFMGTTVRLILLLGQFLNKDFATDNASLLSTYDTISRYFTACYTIFIVIKTFQLIFHFESEEQSKAYNLNNVPTATKWLKQLLYIAFALCLLWILILVLSTAYPDSPFNTRRKYYIIWVTLSLVTYWLGYLGVHYVGLFGQRQEIRTNIIEQKPQISSPKIDYKNDRFQEIDHVIQSEKLYLNPQLNLALIANRFQLSEGYLSQIINSNANSNFSTYINKLRVEAAKKMLRDPEYTNYTTVAIALESGFNSKSAFYNAFKKEMDISPKEYRQQL